jgi:hypothetical protein
MSYTLTSLDDGHILLFTMNSDFDTPVDMPKYLKECYDLVDNGPDQIVIITDTTGAPPKGINDLIQGANSIRTPEAKRINDHPKVIRSLSVVDNRLVNLAVKGLNSAAFGFYEVAIFETKEEAISHARAVLAGEG